MITGPQAKAARVLIQWPRDHVASRAGVSSDQLAEFESGRTNLDDELRIRLVSTLEEGGAVFLEESADAGAGVRLKFPRKDVRSIRRLENEGGPIGDDDV